MIMWYVRTEEGKTVGPAEQDAIQAEIRAGNVGTGCWVCEVGGSQWVAIRTHPVFATCFAPPSQTSKPPPPPLPRTPSVKPAAAPSPVQPAAVSPAAPVGPIAPTPKAGGDEKEKKKGFELNLGELFVDKSIDFVIMFVGLYLALAVQDWQDARKEHQDYVALLENFKTEITHNQSEKKSIESSLGPMVADVPEDQALGSLKKRFDDFRSQAQKAETLFACLETFISVAGKGQPSPDEVKKLTECGPVLEEADKAGKEEDFKPISLSPVYRDDVWQLYLANGVKYFENKDLAIKIGAIYTKLKVIEKSVAEIEATFNESFGQRIGDMMGSVAELEDMIPEGESEAESEKTFREKGPELGVKLGGLTKEMRQHRHAVSKTEAILALKIERLRTLVVDVDKLFAETQAEIDKELAKAK